MEGRVVLSLSNLTFTWSWFLNVLGCFVFIAGLASDINMCILIVGLPKEPCSICEKFFLVDLAEKRVALTGMASRCGANKLARADRIFVGLTSFAV